MELVSALAGVRYRPRKKRIAVVEDWRNTRYLVYVVVDEKTEVAGVAIRIENDGVEKEDVCKTRIDKNFFTVICPYIAETAVVRCSDGRFQCNFPNLEIRAATNSFLISGTPG